MKKTLATTIACLALAASAQAATLSYEFSFDNPLETTEIAQGGRLGLFDGALGTLTGATLTLTGSMNQTLLATNLAAQSQLFDVTSTIELSFGSSLPGLAGRLSTGGPQLTLAASTAREALDTGASRTLVPLVAGGSTTIDLAPWLEQFVQIGGGDFTVSCTSLSGLSVKGGGGNLGLDQRTQAQCGASVLYAFGPSRVTNATVPEPTSLALAMLALAVGGVARRGRARS